MSIVGRRILVVDDDPAVRRAVATDLAAAGYEVIEAAQGEEGALRFREFQPDLVVTDLAMPQRDGFWLLAEVRRAGRTPVLVLSVRADEQDKVRALDAGADDYVTKPFSARELLARVRSLLRRLGTGSAPEVRRFADLELDLDRRRVIRDGVELHLTPIEFALLDLLTANAGRPVTHRQIVAAVWRGAPGTSTDTVRVHVGSLRRKLETDPANPRFLATEPWVGYRFLPEPIEP
ncbi:MAG: response regulator transcription factor [Thermoanaerobaculia bacterium]